MGNLGVDFRGCVGFWVKIKGEGFRLQGLGEIGKIKTFENVRKRLKTFENIRKRSKNGVKRAKICKNLCTLTDTN